MRHSKGISMLEVLLVIAIAAVLSMGSVHLYLRSKGESLLLQATTQIQRIVTASNQWLVVQRLPDFSSREENLIPQLVEDKLLEPEDELNPWGGDVSAQGNTEGRLLVRFSHIPSDACSELSSHFGSAETEDNFTCSDNEEEKDNTWEGTF
jgi:type II secretory pathway pseudopilin PulG